MNIPHNSSAMPHSILYTMVRVGDLDRAIDFYRDALGMREVRRETFTEARFTLVFMGFADDPSGATIELTWNWDESGYSHGSGYGHIALAVADIGAACRRLEAMDVKILRPAGPMMFAPDETAEREHIAFIEDPDGYRIELIEVD